MSKIVSTEVFQYRELSEEAKAKARDWYRDASMEDSDFADAVIEDAGYNIGSGDVVFCVIDNPTG